MKRKLVKRRVSDSHPFRPFLRERASSSSVSDYSTWPQYSHGLTLSNPPLLNFAFHPHLLDLILGSLDIADLIPLRLVCSLFRDEVDVILARQTVVHRGGMVPLAMYKTTATKECAHALYPWDPDTPDMTSIPGRIKDAIKQLDIMPCLKAAPPELSKLPNVKVIRAPASQDVSCNLPRTDVHVASIPRLCRELRVPISVQKRVVLLMNDMVFKWVLPHRPLELVVIAPQNWQNPWLTTRNEHVEFLKLFCARQHRANPDPNCGLGDLCDACDQFVGLVDDCPGGRYGACQLCALSRAAAIHSLHKLAALARRVDRFAHDNATLTLVGIDEIFSFVLSVTGRPGGRRNFLKRVNKALDRQHKRNLSPEVLTERIKFMSLAQYTETVGEERVALETTGPFDSWCTTPHTCLDGNQILAASLMRSHA